MKLSAAINLGGNVDICTGTVYGIGGETITGGNIIQGSMRLTGGQFNVPADATLTGVGFLTFDGALVRACRLAGVEVLTQADQIAEPGRAYPARRRPAARGKRAPRRTPRAPL